MQEKRFSLNDLIIGFCILCGIVFFAFCLFAVNLYANKGDSKSTNQIISLNKGIDSAGITADDLKYLYQDKLTEIASTFEYGDKLYYSVLDINGDGIVDLVAKVVSQSGNIEYQFYTFDADEYNATSEQIVYAGSVSSDNFTLYQMDGDNFLIAVGNYSYYIYLNDAVVSTFKVNVSDNIIKGKPLVFSDFQDLEIVK